MMARDEVVEGQQRQLIPRWNIATRIAFRFFFIYLGLFILYFCPIWLQALLYLKKHYRFVLGGVWPMPQLVSWTGAHFFSVTGPLGPGVGFDGIYYWAEAFCLLVIAVLATAVWSVLDRHRENYVTLQKWFRVVVRFVLAAIMVGYGMFKVIPAQMPFPDLFRLVQPLGHFSLMEVLWASMGAAPAYEIFAGCAELLGGILLTVPRTTALGALICLGDITNVLMIDMSYNVANKLQVFHLFLLTVFLLAPESSRLANVFLFNRGAPPSTQPALFRTRRTNRIALAAQVILGVYLVGINAYQIWTQDWRHLGRGGAPKPVLYGIWNVDEISVNGQLHTPILTDNDRWRRVIFDGGIIHSVLVDDSIVAFQRPDDSFAYYRSSINLSDKTLTLADPRRKAWVAHFRFERAAPDQLVLDGEMDEHKIHMQLHLVDREKFELVNDGFHWIQ